MNATMIVYLTPDKRSFQKITPSKDFDGSWKLLAEAITGSNSKYGVINYHSFEII